MRHELFQRRGKFPRQLLRLACLIVACSLVGACALRRVAVAPPPDLSWTKRAISADQLHQLTERDPALTPAGCMEILARLNHKDRCYIRRDIKDGKALKVPNDFRAYLDWSPLPSHLEQVAQLPEFILVVKDIAFLGWYENGQLRGNTYVCIGRKPKWTRAGWYRVRNKDIDHVSSSYRSALGYPALMPFALRIYGRVWIHGGDVTKGNCSHGCINLPLDAAQQLYSWANPGTKVLIVESLQDLDEAIEKHSRLLKGPARTSTGHHATPRIM